MTEATAVPAFVRSLAARLPAELVVTHISWVLLAPGLAYKVKQPVRLPFLDYSTLAARRHCCEEEVRLNRRLAPSLYLGVSRITGSPEAPAIDGDGPLLDYAVRMRRFAPGSLFAEQVDSGRLAPAAVDALAALLARFQRQAAVASAASGFGTAPQRLAVAVAAARGAAPACGESLSSSLRAWLEQRSAALAALWRDRLARGFVREGHGDLHLDNIVTLDGDVAAFDGIEFDPALRWIDVIDDLAFAVMDFAARGRRDFAFRLLGAWLDHSGDHGGVPALPFAAAYRALVRAQVEHLRGRDEAARRYAQAAWTWTQPMDPKLTITHGLPGSGKTFASQRLLEREDAIRLRSDVERKRLLGLDMLASSRASGVDAYSPQATQRTYAHLYATARGLLQAGWPVIIDAAFLRRDERLAARELARELRVPFAIAHCDAPDAVLRERLRARHGDASEADVAVLEQLERIAEPLADDELAVAVSAQAVAALPAAPGRR